MRIRFDAAPDAAKSAQAAALDATTALKDATVAQAQAEKLAERARAEQAEAAQEWKARAGVGGGARPGRPVAQAQPVAGAART